MHKYNFLFILFFFTFFMFSFTEPKKYTDRGTEGVLAEEEIIKKSEQALKGDLYAAFDLFDHYMSVSMDFKDDFMNKASYWSVIAAENDTYGRNMYTLYSFNKYFNVISEVRSIFWLKKSAGLKYKDSLDEIERLKISIEDEFTMDVSSHKFSLEEYEESAEAGNQQAAVYLSDRYKKAGDKELEKYWLRICAQNGNKECMKKYAELLKQSKDEYDNIRAEFWEKKAKS